MIESQKEELHRAQAEELHRRDQQLLHEQLLQQKWDLREAHEKSLNEMEELSIEAISRPHIRYNCEEKIGKIEILSLNSRARFRNYRKKLIV